MVSSKCSIDKGTCIAEQDCCWSSVERVSINTNQLAFFSFFCCKQQYNPAHTVVNTFFCLCFSVKFWLTSASFALFDGNGLLTTFADDKDGDSSVLDFTVHCLRYDDIVHKEDSVGYRVFLTTGFFVSPPPSPLIIQHFFTCCFNLFFLSHWSFFSLSAHCDSNYIS